MAEVIASTEQKPQRKNAAAEKLIRWIDLPNIATELPPEVLRDMATVCIEEYDYDKSSRKDWEIWMAEALKLATMLTEPPKEEPWGNASNAIYPLIAEAALRFSSRALPNTIKEAQIVKGRVIGKDEGGQKAARAQRIGEFMSYQLMEQQPEWLPDHDKGLTILPVMGCFFKKTYRDYEEERNVSELVNPMDVVIHFKAKSLDSAKRITHVFEIHKNQVIEKQRSKVFLDIDLGAGDTQAVTGEIQEREATYVIHEQHRRWDLDGDGYAEPYIVTFHRQSNQVLRIKARYKRDSILLTPNGRQIAKIIPRQHFTKYTFLRAFDSNIYDFGFGQFLGHSNRTSNALLREIIDAGSFYNGSSGVICKGLLPKGATSIRLRPNEFEPVNDVPDIRTKMMMVDARPPAQATYSTLELSIQAGQRLGSTEDVLAGKGYANQPASTTLALIEQGLKVVNSILMRINLAAKEEFRKLFELNKENLTDEAYYMVQDEARAVARADFEDKDCDVVPVSTTADTTQTEALIKAEVVWDKLYENAVPVVREEIAQALLAALNIPDREKYRTPADWRPPEDPKIAIEMHKLDLQQQEIAHDRERLGYEGEKLPFEIAKLKVECIKMLAEAEAKEVGEQFNKYKEQIEGVIASLPETAAKKKPATKPAARRKPAKAV